MTYGDSWCPVCGEYHAQDTAVCARKQRGTTITKPERMSEETFQTLLEIYGGMTGDGREMIDEITALRADLAARDKRVKEMEEDHSINMAVIKRRGQELIRLGCIVEGEDMRSIHATLNYEGDETLNGGGK